MTNQEAINRIQSSACTDESGCVCRHFPSCLYSEDVCEFKLAIQALEKQIPKKPDFEGDGYDNHGNLIYDTWICPCCENKYELEYEEYDYCPECGQKIDWKGA